MGVLDAAQPRLPLGVAAPDPPSAWLQAKVNSTKTLSLPAMLVGGADCVSPSDALKQAPKNSADRSGS